MTRDEIVAIMLAGMAQHGVRTDIMEHLTLGNPDWGTPPKGIYAALAALEARGMVVVDSTLSGGAWSKSRGTFVRLADRYTAAQRHEEQMIIADQAPKDMWAAMLAARPEQE